MQSILRGKKTVNLLARGRRASRATPTSRTSRSD
jgi:hypothetical protein